MRCREFERLLFERDERALDADEARWLDDHLRSCPACRGFEAERLRIRETLRGGIPASVPEPLDSETRALALEAVRGGENRRRAGLPAPVAAALAVLIVVTAAWLTATLSNFSPGQEIPVQAWAALGLIAQNALMLFAAPVLLRSEKSAKNGARPMKPETQSGG